MLHLEREGIIHKDLASRNVLITETDTAKVAGTFAAFFSSKICADFGLSRVVQPVEKSTLDGELVYVSKKNFGYVFFVSISLNSSSSAVL